jgi:hypothetical protein
MEPDAGTRAAREALAMVCPPLVLRTRQGPAFNLSRGALVKPLGTLPVSRRAEWRLRVRRTPPVP